MQLTCLDSNRCDLHTRLAYERSSQQLFEWKTNYKLTKKDSKLFRRK